MKHKIYNVFSSRKFMHVLGPFIMHLNWELSEWRSLPENHSNTDTTVLLLKIWHEDNNIAWASPNFNIQHSICTHILFPYMAYTHDDLCQIIRDYFQSFGKGCWIIRRAEEVQYYNLESSMSRFWTSPGPLHTCMLLSGFYPYCMVRLIVCSQSPLSHPYTIFAPNTQT